MTNTVGTAFHELYCWYLQQHHLQVYLVLKFSYVYCFSSDSASNKRPSFYRNKNGYPVFS